MKYHTTGFPGWSRIFVLWIMIFNVFSSHGKDSNDTIPNKETFSLSNSHITWSIFFENGRLIKDKMEARPDWLKRYNTREVSFETDGDFSLEIMWTGWRAPGRENNADNLISLSKNDFQLRRSEYTTMIDGTKALNLYFNQTGSALELVVTCQLEPEAFYIRRKITISDTSSELHFLHKIRPLNAMILNEISVIKNGGFGQPVAALTGDGGAFFGVEYPTAHNTAEQCSTGRMQINSGYEPGMKIGRQGVSSEWVVIGVTPEPYVKLWFQRYLQEIAVSHLKPYLKYNGWCDVRSPELAEGQGTVMNEKNILRIIDDFNRELTEKRGIKLDAFVLDDGWDIYKSDWVLRKDEFPNGLKPVTERLNELGIRPGIWFGPIGGYSHRDWRVDWMKENGYEVTGDQLCLGGKNYYNLFSKRVLDFMRNEKVSHFKWDGIQFSCSESGHGHPVGIYSPHAITDSVIHLCHMVRQENPEAFINITSGTWLSPWWIQYANTIWMQGDDWGYATVPALHPRDREITFRDIGLYNDFRKNDFWFPISNLMTVGIIKGHLANLGGTSESLPDFTNNALFCLSRGVTMWELYISPDLLSEEEWDAIAGSIIWAKDRFDILKNTEMTGGDPGKREAYGYSHFAGNRGVISARNPFINPQKLTVELSASYGLNPEADSLVIERVYPTRWISPRLNRSGENFDIHLEGFETAVYEIYPVSEATYPLVSGVTFDIKKMGDDQCILEAYHVSDDVKILNPELIRSVQYEKEEVPAGEFHITPGTLTDAVHETNITSKANQNHSEIGIGFNLHSSVKKARLSVLFEAANKEINHSFPETVFILDGKKTLFKSEKQEGEWAWFYCDISPGKHHLKILVKNLENDDPWAGSIASWLQTDQEIKGEMVTLNLANSIHEPPMPPHPLPANEIKKSYHLGDVIFPGN